MVDEWTLGLGGLKIITIVLKVYNSKIHVKVKGDRNLDCLE